MPKFDWCSIQPKNRCTSACVRDYVSILDFRNHVLLWRWHSFRCCGAELPRLRAMLIIASVLASLPRTAAAQTGDSLLSVGREFYPYAHVLDGTQRQAKFDILRAQLTAPVPISEQTRLLFGVAYEEFDAHLHGSDHLTIPTLRSLVGTLGIVQKYGPFIGIVITGAGKASEFSDQSTRDGYVFTLNGIGLYRLSGSLSVGAGISYDQRKGTPTPLPAVRINWRFAENARLRGFIPSWLDLELRANRWVTGGVRSALNSKRYQLGNAGYGGLQVDYLTVTVGPKLTLSASDWVHLDLYTSVALYRRYDLYHGQDETGGVSVAPAVAFGVRLWIGPSLWETR